MVAEHDDDPAAYRGRFGRELLQATNDAERIRASVGDVAKLDQGRAPAAPVPLGVDQPGGAGDFGPRLIIAVEIADRDDAGRRLSRGGKRGERRGQKQRRAEHFSDQSHDRLLRHHARLLHPSGRWAMAFARSA